MILKIIILAFICILCFGIYAIQTAEEGYEDDEYFYYGKQVKK